MKFQNLIEKNLEPTYYLEPNYLGQYPEQMPIYLLIDLAESPPTVYMGTFNFQLNGTPEDIWNNRCLCFELPPMVDASLMHDCVNEDLKEDIEFLVDNIEIEWNGNNYVGQFDSDTQYFRQQFEYTLRDRVPTMEYGGIYSPKDYLREVTTWPDEDNPKAKVSDFIITSDTTDEEIEKIAKEIEDDVDDCYVINGSFYDYLSYLREECERYE